MPAVNLNTASYEDLTALYGIGHTEPQILSNYEKKRAF